MEGHKGKCDWMMSKLNFISLAGVFLLVAFIGFSSAVLTVTSLACPSAVSVGQQFTCTATIAASGSAHTVSYLEIHGDSNNWLEQASYRVDYPSVQVAQDTSQTFDISGLISVASGTDNGFSKIIVDGVTHQEDAITTVEVNTINIVTSVSNSESSKAMGGNITVTTEITAGGDLDSVTLTHTVNSGGCSIINQNSSFDLGEMNHDDLVSRTWTVTMGESGDCVYTISASATTGGATKIDSTQNSIDCSDCPEEAAAGGAAAGGGGGGATSVAAVNELTGPVTYDLGVNEKVDFKMGGENHSVTVLNLTAIEAELIVQSTPQQFKLAIKGEKEVDFEGDSEMDLRVKLDSVNILTNKAKITITPLVIKKVPGSADDSKSTASEGDGKGESDKKAGENAGERREKSSNTGIYILVIAIVIVVLVILYFVYKKYIKENL